jgi:NADH dehydrogenase FAD-containing subunit
VGASTRCSRKLQRHDERTMTSASTPHLVVIGGGFAGLWCTRALARAPIRITLIDRANHHLFQPLLYQVATGQVVPSVAPAAKQMGAHVVRNLLAKLRGQATTPFTYQDYGNLATIGRRAAVVDLRGLRFSGVLAWWFWLAAHVFFLIGFRNRFVVLTNWAWAYCTYQRHARVVLGTDK